MTVDFATPDQPEILAVINSKPVTVGRLNLEEGYSTLSCCAIEFTWTESEALEASAASVVGSGISLGINGSVQLPDGTSWSKYYFHGIVRELTYLGEVADPSGATANATKSRYQAVVVPREWLLTQTSQCRVFQKKTTKQIVELILKEYGITTTCPATPGLPIREYRVQYNESDFDFISRLLEEDGITYYFVSTAAKTEIRFSNAVTSDTAISLRIGDGATSTNTSDLFSWKRSYKFRPRSYAVGDFNDKNTTAAIRDVKKASKLTLANWLSTPDHLHKVYEYPGNFVESNGTLDKAAGETLATARMEQLEATYDVTEASGYTLNLAVGKPLKLAGTLPPGVSQTDEFTIRSLRLSTDNLDSAPAGATTVANISCVPKNTVYRPPRTTARPVVNGPQTAVVTDAGGTTTIVNGSANIDTEGRVRVLFHWDTSPASTTDKSCWIRVSQAWAGNTYGSMILPHVGQEVIVSFLDGNPDRPLITGRVYNSSNRPFFGDATSVSPHRAVIARDHAGNEIVMDANEGRVEVNNAKDRFEVTVGTSASFTAGMDFGITIGCGIGINVGAAVGLSAAAAFDLSMGWTTSISVGSSQSWSYGASFTKAVGRYVNAGDSLGQIAFKEPADFVSMKQVSMAGGGGGPEPNNSVLVGTGQELVLSYGPKDATFGIDTSQYAKVMVGGAVAGFVAAGLAGTTGYLATKSAQGDKETSDLHAGLAAVAGAGTLASSIVAAVLLKKYAATWKGHVQNVHSAPLATVKLAADGANVSSATQVELTAQTNIVNNAFAAYFVNSPNATFTGAVNVRGALKSPNIVDLGDPAAASAAIQQVNAKLGIIRQWALASNAAQRATRAQADANASAIEAMST